VNDTYGHQAGDFVLMETAHVLKKASRGSDILCRYGGEELLTILPGISPKNSCLAAEKFRLAIQNHAYVFNGVTIPVTVSVGVSFFFYPSEPRKAVIERADRCLYLAKRSTRNAVYVDFGTGAFLAADYLNSNP